MIQDVVKITQNQKREKYVLSIKIKINYFCPQICGSAVKDPEVFFHNIYISSNHGFLIVFINSIFKHYRIWINNPLCKSPIQNPFIMVFPKGFSALGSSLTFKRITLWNGVFLSFCHSLFLCRNESGVFFSHHRVSNLNEIQVVLSFMKMKLMRTCLLGKVDYISAHSWLFQP